jgi:alpha/beta superfamily hydrolase
MGEEKVSIVVDQEVTLLGGYTPGRGDGPGGAVLLHPHPLYGGSMHNNVVEACREGALAAGWAVLRFNFRGVAGSTGRHGQGKGEVWDVLAAARWLAQRVSGPLALIGYSFGSLVGAQAALKISDLAGAVWVAPPLMLGPLPAWPQDAGPLLVIAGGADEYTRLAELEEYVQAIGARGALIALPGGDHFYQGAESVLIDKVQGFLPGLKARCSTNPSANI